MKKMKLNIQLFASGESSVFTDSPLQMKMKWSSKPSESVSNASDVTCEIYGRRTSGSTKGRQWNGYINIGGNIHNFSQIYTKTSTTVGTSWVLMAYYTDTIVHDSDGTKTITIYGGLGGPSGTSIANNWCEGSTTAILDQLASPATLNSVDITNFVSQGKFTPNFTINQSGLYYGMYIIAYTPSQTIVSWNSPIAVSNGVEATLTDAQKQTLWNYLDERENRTAVDIMFVLASYSDSSLSGDYQIGTSDIHFQNTIAIPQYSLQWNTTTVSDGNANIEIGGHTLSYYAGGNFVKGLSLPVISLNATSSTGYNYGKTITYYINGVARPSQYTDNDWNGASTYEIFASDGREDTHFKINLNINVVDYFIPYLSNIRVVRPIPTDDIVRISYTANYYDGTGLSNLSNATYNFYYRESESDNWTPVSTLSGSGTSGSQTFSNVDIDNLNYKKPFYYKIEFTDRIGNAMAVNPYTSSIPKGLPVWNAYTDSNDTNVLNVNGELRQEDESKYFTSKYDGSYYWQFDTDANEYRFNKQVVSDYGFWTNGNITSWGTGGNLARRETLENVSFNTIGENYPSGLYAVNANGNMPSVFSSGTWFYLTQIRQDNWCYQEIVQWWDPLKKYIRRRISGSWSNWEMTPKIISFAGNTSVHITLDDGWGFLLVTTTYRQGIIHFVGKGNTPDLNMIRGDFNEMTFSWNGSVCTIGGLFNWEHTIIEGSSDILDITL